MIEYPKILTDADWQKEKGIVAKMVGETGMGDAMKKCKSAYDALPWIKLKPLTTYKSEVALATAKAEAMVAGKEFATLQKAFYVLRDHAKKVQDKFKAHKLIPKSSTEHVGKIISQCEFSAVEAKSQFDPLMAAFAEAENRMLGARAMALKIVNSMIPRLKELILAVAKKPTSAFYNETCWQPVRAFAAAVAKAPPLAGLQPEWKTLSSITPPTIKDGAPMKVHTDKLTNLLGRTATAATI